MQMYTKHMLIPDHMPFSTPGDVVSIVEEVLEERAPMIGQPCWTLHLGFHVFFKSYCESFLSFF